jgi:hypothetical protein
MSILRKAAITASSAVLLTAVGAISGIGTSAAQAYHVSASQNAVVVDLTAADTATFATDADAVYHFCAGLDGETTMISFIRPPTEGVCEPLLSNCAQHAEGRPAVIIFYWFSTECRFQLS